MSYKVNNPVDRVKFDKKFYLSMLSGDKTQTMRIARKRLDVQKGDVVTAVFPGFDKTLTIEILDIGYKQMKSIDDEDAILEGYVNKNELIKNLQEIYPNLDRWDRVYYYRFRVL